MSDHSPVFLDTLPPKWGPTTFRFENVWVEHKHFCRNFEKWSKEIPVEWWESYKWMKRLQKIKTIFEEMEQRCFRGFADD